jgi:glucarate dehydratase
MKIDRIEATVVNVPLEVPYDWAYGELPGYTRTIVQVFTSDGIVGLGESPGASSARLIAEELAPALTGRDPIDIQGCEAMCMPPWRGVQSIHDWDRIHAWGGLEVALWDIRGKAWNRPLYDLLGGAVRKQIPFTEYFAFRGRWDGKGGEETPEAVADYCLRRHEEHGATFFEGKLSTADPRPSITLIELLRRRLGDGVMIRVDTNHAYSLATARAIAPALEALGVRNWEDPVGSIEEMRVLRQHTRIPFSTHNLDFARAVEQRVPDAFVSSPAILGGLLRFQRFVGACEAAGIDFWCYSGDAGIMSAAYLHVCAAIQWIREPNQALFRMQPYDVIAEGPFRPKDNLLPVPEGPGLGVTLAPDRLDFLRRHFEQHGPMNKYQDRFAPGRFRRMPLV